MQEYGIKGVLFNALDEGIVDSDKRMIVVNDLMTAMRDHGYAVIKKSLVVELLSRIESLTGEEN